jgi:hypothetical protein
MNYQRWILVLCGGLFFCVCPCVVRGGDELVSEILLNQAGLRSTWQIQLPLKPSEQVERLYVFDAYLYILTNQNFFFCIERSSGLVRSLQSIAVAGLPISPPIHFEKRSVFLIGQELKVFDPAVGQMTKTMKLLQLGGCYGSIARNSDTVYICGSDNRLYAYSVKEGIRLYMVTADNDSPIHSVIASDKMVWFATTAGNVVAMEPWNHQKVWQFNLSGKMTAPLVQENDFIYAAGLDAKLYKLDSKTGRPAWKEPFAAGCPVQELLIPGKTCVYVFTENTGLYAVNKQTGKAVWNLPQGRFILSEQGDQSYVYVQPGVLMQMDNTSGKEKLSFNISGIDRFAVNMTDSVLCLAEKNGRVMAVGQILEKDTGPAKP